MIGNKGCHACKYCMTEDTGYSNWTVMGTEHTCLKGANPDMPFHDEFASFAESDKVLGFGETCALRVEGVGPHFDVDGETSIEDACGDDAELLELVRAARTRE